MRALFCGSGWFEIVDAIRDKLPVGDSVDVWDRDKPLVEVVPGYEVIFPSNGHIGADVIAAADSLGLIQQPAAGVDGVDKGAARARGIPVCNAPGANNVSVAETAVFLMLSLARRSKQAVRAFRERRIGVPIGRELSGRTLGIVGLGRSGGALASIAAGFGMPVVSVGSSSTEGDWRATLGAADIVSMHCPLTRETRGLIDGAKLSMCKRGAWLINCARGPVLDRAAVVGALASGTLGGLGLDVYWDEPWDPGDPLFSRDDVVTTPHVAGSSEESYDRISSIVVDNMARLKSRAPLRHRVV